jgi:hypothetical protein
MVRLLDRCCYYLLCSTLYLSPFSSSAAHVKVLTTKSARLLQWTCFDAEYSAADCCRAIQDSLRVPKEVEVEVEVDAEVGVEVGSLSGSLQEGVYVDIDVDVGVGAGLADDCDSQLATIPTSLPLLLEHPADTDTDTDTHPRTVQIAQFSLVRARADTSTSTSTSTTSTSMKGKPFETYQWIWGDDDDDGDDEQRLRAREIVSSPYFLEPSKSSRSRFHKSISIQVSSKLSPQGGMHRLLHHQITMIDQGTITASTDDDATTTATTTTTTTSLEQLYLFLHVPRGMFVDLDDAVTVDNASTSRTTTTTASSKGEFQFEFQWKVHAAEVCDIEQPAFDSGQHVIVVELPPGGSQYNLSSKFHLRYPDPSLDYEQWIDLVEPHVVGIVVNGNNIHGHGHGHARGYKREQAIIASTEGFGILERVWVAAGSDDDYDWVMWTTIAACWVGVVWMLSDISHVSHWDTVQ